MLVQINLTPLHQNLDKECPQVPAQKERPHLPHPEQDNAAGRAYRLDGCGNVDVLATTAKTRQSEQGALKEEGIDLLVMPDD